MWGPGASARVSSVKSDLLSNCRNLWDSSWVTAGMNRASSPVETGTSDFLSISDISLRVSVEFEWGSQVSFCVEA